MSTIVKIVPNDKANPPGKLADAELHFTDGVLDGLKLIGFAVWERRTGNGRNVTFPARQYAVNGERRSFALLRPIADVAAQERVRELVLQAYAEYEQDGDRGRFVAVRAMVPDAATRGGVRDRRVNDHGHNRSQSSRRRCAAARTRQAAAAEHAPGGGVPGLQLLDCAGLHPSGTDPRG